MHQDCVVLEPGREKPILNRHHWIFSRAVSKMPVYQPGDCLPVADASGAHLGYGYFNPKAQIIGRMVSFDKTLPEEAIKRHLHDAIAMRNALIDERQTNAYRLVNGEGDMLPGLIVDRYGDVLVVQVSTLGMEKLLPLVVEWLMAHLKPTAIYEKSLVLARREEGLGDRQGALYGDIPTAPIEIKENGLRFSVSILHGQKTGFFLDHREMRKMIGERSCGRRVLNCFSYTGGFGVYAAKGGAELVDSVDVSEAAVKMAEHNMTLNQLSSSKHSYLTADVFDFLREQPLDYDLVILDPPAFTKRRKDTIAACRGYKEINRLALQKIPRGALLLTSSCSYYVDEKLFRTVIFQAAVEAKRAVKIIGRHRLAIDHPVNVCHPEGNYLKSLLLVASR